MLKITNSKSKFTLGMAALATPLLSIGSLTYLTFTPESAHAAEDNKTINDITYMQEMSPHVCASMQESTATVDNGKVLIDYRDKKEYKVAKLKDGNCWMTQNLALEGGTTLTINDSDLDPSVFTDTSKVYTLPTAITTAFYSIQTTDKNGISTFSNQQVRNPANPDTNKYGAYYSWCVATAGTCLRGVYEDIIPNSNNAGNAGNVSNTTAVPANQNATSSICPKGWQLPVNGNTATDKSYNKLLSGFSGSTGNAIMLNSPYEFVYSGSVINYSALDYTGSRGIYWSSTGNTNAISATSSADNIAYSLYFFDNSVSPSANSNRYFGNSVRCVNSDTFYDWQAPNVSVTIPNILTIDATSNMNAIANLNDITTGTISATISANTNYDVMLSSDQPNLQNGNDTTNTIKPVSINNTTLTNNTWGIRTSGSSTNALYSPITTTPTNFLNTTSTNPNGSTTHTYDIGAKVAPSLPAGTYSTTVTITASTK